MTWQRPKTAQRSFGMLMINGNRLRREIDCHSYWIPEAENRGNGSQAAIQRYLLHCASLIRLRGIMDVELVLDKTSLSGVRHTLSRRSSDLR